MAFAVIAMIGKSAVVFSIRSASVACNPSIPGMRTSMRMQSKGAEVARSIASLPSFASVTTAPASSSISLAIC